MFIASITRAGCGSRVWNLTPVGFVPSSATAVSYKVPLDSGLYCSYNYAVFVLDEAKRKSNLKKHGLDFVDAHLVYDNPDKCTYDSSREGEQRWMDIAVAVIRGRFLALIYTERGDDVRVISFRPASREEREQYEHDKE